MNTTPRLTPNEAHLLTVIEYIQDDDDRQALVTLTDAVNAVLAEALRPGYEIDFAEGDGLVLHTPTGLKVWFAPSDEDSKVVVLATIQNDGTLDEDEE
ncbi:MAG TPA: hypothetical protein VMV29_07910 [Ktedonobacterales bacterium]|nr:hypothetical protein [Ktedonobacterales bacterium]